MQSLYYVPLIADASNKAFVIPETLKIICFFTSANMKIAAIKHLIIDIYMTILSISIYSDR